jgi:hypothetical protein
MSKTPAASEVKPPAAQSAVGSADAMHQALGEFLTDMGRVEFEMFSLMGFLTEARLDAVFKEITAKPFSEKIESFKKWCDWAGVGPAQKPTLQAIYNDLHELLPKRSFLIHGETREGAFEGMPRQFYRVGLVKDNLYHLHEFDRGKHGPNIFDVRQVQAVSQLCRKILVAMANLRVGAASTR